MAKDNEVHKLVGKFEKSPTNCSVEVQPSTTPPKSTNGPESDVWYQNETSQEKQINNLRPCLMSCPLCGFHEFQLNVTIDPSVIHDTNSTPADERVGTHEGSLLSPETDVDSTSLTSSQLILEMIRINAEDDRSDSN